MPRGYSIKLKAMRAAIAEYLQQGKDSGETASYFGCSVSTVEAAAWEHGITLPHRRYCIELGAKILKSLIYEPKLTLAAIAESYGTSITCVRDWYAAARKVGISVRIRKVGRPRGALGKKKAALPVKPQTKRKK